MFDIWYEIENTWKSHVAYRLTERNESTLKSHSQLSRVFKQSTLALRAKFTTTAMSFESNIHLYILYIPQTNRVIDI